MIISITKLPIMISSITYVIILISNIHFFNIDSLGAEPDHANLDNSKFVRLGLGSFVGILIGFIH